MMDLRNKKILFYLIMLAALAAIIIVVGSKMWIWYTHELTWEEFSWMRDLDSLIYASSSEINENDIAFVIDKELSYPISRQAYIPEHYVICADFVGRRRLWRDSESSASKEYDWENVNFHVYDIFTKERVRTIDLLSLLYDLEEDLIEEFGYTESTLSYRLEARENGELYIWFRLRERRNDSWTDRRHLWLRMNFHTGEVTVEESFLVGRQWWTREEDLNFSLQMSVLSLGHMWNVGDYDIFSINGIEVEAWGNVSMPNFTIWGGGSLGSTLISLQAKLLPEESQSLYSRFPSLRQFQGQEDLEVNIVITGYPTAEEILEMFMEDGREISFEGLVLSGDLSIDGEYHEINSFEDYFKLIDSSWLDELDED